MNKLFLLSALSAMTIQSASAAPVVIHVTAPAVTVTGSGTRNGYGSGGPVQQSWYNYQSTVAATTRTRARTYAPAPTAVAASATVATSAPAASTSSSSTSSSSGALNISQDDFMKAWTNGKQFLPDANITPPTADQYKAFVNNAATAGGIASKTELAMFLAEIMWESGGLIYKSEIACKTNNCAGSYSDAVGLPGKFYYGRGYIQLTWGANYKEASTALFNDDRLLQNPDLVASNEDYAWDVSFWYWKSRVKPTLNNSFNFGLATKAINGALECSGSNTDKATKRYKIYTEILKVFEPSATPIEAGCYN